MAHKFRELTEKMSKERQDRIAEKAGRIRLKTTFYYDAAVLAALRQERATRILRGVGRRQASLSALVNEAIRKTFRRS